MLATDSASETRRPAGFGSVPTRGVRLTVGLTLIETARIIGLLFVFEMVRGNVPSVFALPAGIGDTLIGVTAPVVAFALRRGGARTWATAIAWNALGITDLVYAFALATLGGAQYVTSSYLAVIPFVAVPIEAIVHLLAIRTLLTRDVMQYYVARA